MAIGDTPVLTIIKITAVFLELFFDNELPRKQHKTNKKREVARNQARDTVMTNVSALTVPYKLRTTM